MITVKIEIGATVDIGGFHAIRGMFNMRPDWGVDMTGIKRRSRSIEIAGDFMPDFAQVIMAEALAKYVEYVMYYNHGITVSISGDYSEPGGATLFFEGAMASFSAEYNTPADYIIRRLLEAK